MFLDLELGLSSNDSSWLIIKIHRNFKWGLDRWFDWQPVKEIQNKEKMKLIKNKKKAECTLGWFYSDPKIKSLNV